MPPRSTKLGQARPVSTMVVVQGFLDPRWKVEIEAEAIVG
jgi:enamine deaminase RidA (YjgF/YER057c/UK114 family)